MNPVEELLLKQKKLNWKDMAFGIARVHKEKRREEGVPDRSDKEWDGWTLRKTSEYLGISIGYVSQSLTLVEAIKKNPYIGDYKTLTQALKFLTKEKPNGKSSTSFTESGGQV